MGVRKEASEAIKIFNNLLDGPYTHCMIKCQGTYIHLFSEKWFHFIAFGRWIANIPILRLISFLNHSFQQVVHDKLRFKICRIFRIIKFWGRLARNLLLGAKKIFWIGWSNKRGVWSTHECREYSYYQHENHGSGGSEAMANHKF